MKFTPLSNRVLVKPEMPDKETKGGIVIADTAVNNAPTEGIVVAVGMGRYDNGMLIPMEVDVGDHVTWGKFAGVMVKIDDEPHLLMRENDISGIRG